MHRFLAALGSILLTTILPTWIPAQEPGWHAPALADQIAIRDGRTGERVPSARMFEQLANVDAVFVGETHLCETTHRVELAIYEELLARRQGKVVLSLEMFERDTQQALDDYVQGRIDEAKFVERARPWGNYPTAYRRLIERARQDKLPVVAANFPRPLRRAVASIDPAAADPFAALPEHLRAMLPKQLFANSPAYWRRVDNAVRGHLGMMGGPSSPDDPRLLDMQSLWDNSMGEACADALAQHEGWSVLHVCGGFHTAYWDGTVRQFARRRPEAKVLTVDVEPIANPAAGDVEGEPRADFVVFAESRANDEDEGTYTVVTAREQRYRLFVPEAANDAHRVPLLIWLGDDGLTAEDGLDLCRAMFGDEIAIASLEAPYRERGEDQGDSGRWFWADTFRQDIGVATQAVGRVWGYVLRNLPVDPARVVIAGEGSGATVAAAATMLDTELSCHGIALDPRRYAKIKDFPLPLPELRGDAPAPPKDLCVVGGERDREWWSGELDEYTAIGLPNRFELRDGDPWTRLEQQELLLRGALGLVTGATEQAKRRHVVATATTPRGLHWARLVALRERKAGERVAVLPPGADPADSGRIDIAVRAADFASGARMLPVCPGPFGGTTVIALAPDAPADEVAAWLALEQSDPLAKRSRFHRMRVATADGDRSLDKVLAELLAKNRTNVLILPATFCATAEEMRRLTAVAGEQDAMTLHWRPGFGL